MTAGALATQQSNIWTVRDGAKRNRFRELCSCRIMSRACLPGLVTWWIQFWGDVYARHPEEKGQSLS